MGESTDYIEFVEKNRLMSEEEKLDAIIDYARSMEQECEGLRMKCILQEEVVEASKQWSKYFNRSSGGSKEFNRWLAAVDSLEKAEDKYREVQGG